MGISDQLTTEECINQEPWFIGIEPGTREIIYVVRHIPWRFMPPVGFTGKISLIDQFKNNATFEVNSDGSGGDDDQTYTVPNPPTIPILNTPGFIRTINLIQSSPASPFAYAIFLNLLPGEIRYSADSFRYYWTLTNVAASEEIPITMIFNGVGG